MRQHDKARCPWATKTELYVQYHDAEWGVPIHDDRLLFEFLILEGAQAGLSWETILKKRENYRRAFDNFDPAIVARYGQKKRKGLLADAGIVRNRLKIEAAVQNAKAFLAVQDDIGTFDEYIWGFVGNEPKQNAWKSINEVPAKGASILGPGPTIANGMVFVSSGYGAFGGRPGNVLLAFGADKK